MINLLFLLLTVCWAIPASAQKTVVVNDKLNGVIPLDSEGKPGYERVNKVEGVSKEELFKRASRWFVKTYNSSKDVLQVNDVSSGELIGKGSTPIAAKIQRVTWQNDVDYILSVKIKEGKYRIDLTDFKVGGTPLQLYKLPYIATTQHHYAALFTAIDQKSRELIDSLEKALNTAHDF